jgi:hypothetical protein
MIFFCMDPHWFGTLDLDPQGDKKLDLCFRIQISFNNIDILKLFSQTKSNLSRFHVVLFVRLTASWQMQWRGSGIQDPVAF